MEFLNHTPFPALCFQGLLADQTGFHVVVLSQTFDLSGGRPSFAKTQTPLRYEDDHHGPPGTSSPKEESDLSPFKPRCDILLDGIARAPRGKPCRQFLVRLRVWEPSKPGTLLLDKTLRILGPQAYRKRAWVTRAGWVLVRGLTLGLIARNPWRRTRPGPIVALPLRYEYAFGGEAKVDEVHEAARRVPKRFWLPGAHPQPSRQGSSPPHDSRVLAWEAHDGNPIGKGFARPWHLGAIKAKEVPAPQIESPAAPVTAKVFLQHLRGRDGDGTSGLPQGFGPIGKGWMPRRNLAGRVTPEWIASRRALPDGFDFGFWNCAPPDQQVPHLRGDEVLEIMNIHVPGQGGLTRDQAGNAFLRIQLPGHKPYVLVRTGEGVLDWPAMDLDTVRLDMEAGALILVWRVILPLEPEIVRIEARMVHQEDREEWERRGGPILETAGLDGRQGP